jgi:hypothetical protein
LVQLRFVGIHGVQKARKDSNFIPEIDCGEARFDGWCIGVAKKESRVPRCGGLEKERRFCSMVAEVCAWILARQKVIDRPISRAERMALVLRITRFIGMPMKPAWHARCHPSPCAGLCIFSTGMRQLSVGYLRPRRGILCVFDISPMAPCRTRNESLMARCHGKFRCASPPIVATLASAAARTVQSGCSTQGYNGETTLGRTRSRFYSPTVGDKKTPSCTSSAS